MLGESVAASTTLGTFDLLTFPFAVVSSRRLLATFPDVFSCLGALAFFGWLFLDERLIVGERVAGPRPAVPAAVLFRFSLALGAPSLGGGVFIDSLLSEVLGLPKSDLSDGIGGVWSCGSSTPLSL